ncbi:MAG: FeoB-associated Cys-rich membrane protein [bacterium]
MTPEIQTAIALALVAGAVLYFVRGWLAKRKKPGCGGGCGCSGKKF